MNAQARIKEGTGGENRESFFRRLKLKITPAEKNLLDRAYRWAKYGHRTQLRETGARYFEHLRGGALILVDELGITDVELIIAFWLHDILEDSFMLTLEDIEFNFGKRVAAMVEVLTKPGKGDPRFRTKKERDAWYHARIRRAGTDAGIVKLADRLQNTRALGSCKREKQRRKAAETRRVFLPLARRLACSLPEVGGFFLRETEAALERLDL